MPDRLLGFDPGNARNKDCFEILKTDRRLETIAESCSTCLHDAAAAGAQLTMTAIFNSTALQNMISG
jgi:hypothetical protein